MNSIPRIYKLVNKKRACVFLFLLWSSENFGVTTTSELRFLECNLMSTRFYKIKFQKLVSDDEQITGCLPQKKISYLQDDGGIWKKKKTTL